MKNKVHLCSLSVSQLLSLLIVASRSKHLTYKIPANILAKINTLLMQKSRTDDIHSRWAQEISFDKNHLRRSICNSNARCNVITIMNDHLVFCYMHYTSANRSLSFLLYSYFQYGFKESDYIGHKLNKITAKLKQQNVPYDVFSYVSK